MGQSPPRAVADYMRGSALAGGPTPRRLTAREAALERLLMGLRTDEGVALREAARPAGVSPAERLRQLAALRQPRGDRLRSTSSRAARARQRARARWSAWRLKPPVLQQARTPWRLRPARPENQRRETRPLPGGHADRQSARHHPAGAGRARGRRSGAGRGYPRNRPAARGSWRSPRVCAATTSMWREAANAEILARLGRWRAGRPGLRRRHAADLRSGLSAARAGHRGRCPRHPHSGRLRRARRR